MIDLTKIRYRAIVIDDNNVQYNISEFIQDLGWEENKNEISVRLSFTAKNNDTAKGKLSSIIKPGCRIGIYVTDGNTLDDEAASGVVVDWNPNLSNTTDDLKCICYDDLYQLQKSQDNKYYASGTGTQSIITGLFDEYGIRYNGYSGPNISHGKLKYGSSYVSDIVLNTLEDAKKNGAGKYIVRTVKGITDVIPIGSNNNIFVFTDEVTISVSHSISTSDMVTRVRVFGQADDDGKSSVEATLNGDMRFGIRQRIYTRGSDETTDAANKSAQDILAENREAKTTITVQSPDVPVIRKGDLVYLMAGVSKGYYLVIGIRHDCDSGSMTMDLELSDGPASANGGYSVGDIVYFKGGTHFMSSYPDAKGYSNARPGKAKITIKNGRGKAHPWHLIHTDNESNVYGWVDDGTFE